MSAGGGSMGSTTSVSPLDALFSEFKNDSRSLDLDFGADLGSVRYNGAFPGSMSTPMPTMIPTWSTQYQSYSHTPVPPPESIQGTPGDTFSHQPVDKELQSLYWRPEGSSEHDLQAQAGGFFATGNPFKAMISQDQGTRTGHDVSPLSRDLLPADLPEHDTLDVQLQAPKSKGTSPARSNARTAAKLAREHEKAEKLKEKNKRAQRKFRQRQKDRQESAEKLAADLSKQLKVMQLQKASLETRNRELEWSLGQASQTWSHQPIPQFDPDAEPTWKPSLGWTTFDCVGGMVLERIVDLKLTHSQLMRLSLRDVTKLLGVGVKRLKECLDEFDRSENSPEAAKCLEEILSERRALAGYIAANKPQALNQIYSAKLTDPPVENCIPPAMEFWHKCVEGVVLNESQAQTIVAIRRDFLRKVDKVLQQREGLRKMLMEGPLYVDALNVPSVHNHHAKWAALLEQLRENTELMEKANMFFMARITAADCLSKEHVARIVVRAWPYQVNYFAISRALTSSLGVPNHVETILAERLRREDGPSPVDLFLATIPPWTKYNKLEESDAVSEGSRSSGTLPEFFSIPSPQNQSAESARQATE